jgi:hypothetical protein
MSGLRQAGVQTNPWSGKAVAGWSSDSSSSARRSPWTRLRIICIVRASDGDRQSGFRLAPHELDTTPQSPQGLLAGHKGQVYAERGFRFLDDLWVLASPF